MASMRRLRPAGPTRGCAPGATEHAVRARPPGRRAGPAAGPLEVLDVRGGLGQGRPPHEPRDLLPAAGPGQLRGHLPDRGLARRGHDVKHLTDPGLVVPDQGVRPVGDPPEPVLVGGQRLRAVVAVHRLQRPQVAGQRRVRGARREPDVGRDPRQQVVPGQQQAVVGVVQADMPGSVPGGPHGPDPPARQVHLVAVAEQPVGLGHVEEGVGQAVVGAELGHDLAGHPQRTIQARAPSAPPTASPIRTGRFWTSSVCMAIQAPDASRSRRLRP